MPLLEQQEAESDEGSDDEEMAQPVPETAAISNYAAIYAKEGRLAKEHRDCIAKRMWSNYVTELQLRGESVATPAVYGL